MQDEYNYLPGCLEFLKWKAVEDSVPALYIWLVFELCIPPHFVPFALFIPLETESSACPTVTRDLETGGNIPLIILYPSGICHKPKCIKLLAWLPFTCCVEFIKFLIPQPFNQWYYWNEIFTPLGGMDWGRKACQEQLCWCLFIKTVIFFPPPFPH